MSGLLLLIWVLEFLFAPLFFFFFAQNVGVVKPKMITVWNNLVSGMFCISLRS